MEALDLANMLLAWNDWLVLPALTAGSVVLHLRRRLPSTRLLVVGLTLVLIGQSVKFVWSAPLDPAHLAGAAVYVVGLLLAVAGFTWFLRKDHGSSTSRA
jgi:xanthine/uracil permease